MATNTYKNIPAFSGSSSTQADVNDGAGNPITSTVTGPQRALDVQLVGGDVTIENAELAVEVSAADGDNIAIKDSTGTNALAILPDAGTATGQYGLLAMGSFGGEAKHMSMTDDGYVNVSIKETITLPISAASLPLPAGAATAALQTQPGVDIGDVTINNATLAVTQSGTWDEVGINDSGNSITVDAPVATPVFVRLSDGAAAIATLPVSLASVPSHAVTVASGGIASGALASGSVASGAIASGAVASGAVASGAFASGSISAGAVAAGASSFVKLEDVASADADAGVPAMAVRKASPANTSGTDGDYEMLQISAGRLWASATIDAALPAGTNGIGKLTANSGVDIGDVDVTTVGTITPGTAATSLGKAEDAVHASGDVGVMALATANEANTVRCADGDYCPPAVDTEGNVRIVGNRDSDAVDAGEPVKIGGQARTTNPTAVADADRVNAICDKLGKLVVVGSIRDLKGTQKTTITSSTAETTIVTAVASTFLDLYGLVIANTSATYVSVTIKDSTAGTTRFIIGIPPTDTRGFMLPESAAHNQATVNTNWTATCSASVASVEITALFVKNI